MSVVGLLFVDAGNTLGVMIVPLAVLSGFLGIGATLQSSNLLGLMLLLSLRKLSLVPWIMISKMIRRPHDLAISIKLPGGPIT